MAFLRGATVEVSDEARSLLLESLYVHERIDAQRTGDPAEVQTAVNIDSYLLSEWCRNLRLPDVESLDAHLQRRNISLARLSSVGESIPSRAEDWGRYLDPLLQLLERDAVEISTEEGESLAFAATCDVAGRIARLALEEWKSVHATSEFVTDSAIIDLQDSFRNSVTHIIAPTIALELHITRAGAGGAKTRTALMTLTDSWWRSILRRYPVLGRRLAMAIQAWIGATTELLTRLESDYRVLQECSSGDPLGKVEHISEPLSDPHKGQRTVRALTFSNSTVWFYKPRDLSADYLYGELLRWIEEHGGPHISPIPTILVRSSYGWMEGVRAGECFDVAAVARFYQRLGMHLCLAHIFNMRDLHSENIVAQSEFPVVVDGETFLTPEFAITSNNPQGSAAEASERQFWYDSVVRLSILPRWLPSDGAKCDPSAALQLLRLSEDKSRLNSIPQYQGAQIGARDYVASVLEGFKVAAEFLMMKRSALLEDSAFWENADRISARIVLRATSVYWRVFKNLSQPASLESGLAASIQAEALLKDKFPDLQSAYWRLLSEEQRAILNGDIPYFSYASISVTLSDLDQGGLFFVASAVESVRQRLRALDESEIVKQHDLIRVMMHDDHTSRVSKCSPDDQLDPSASVGEAEDQFTITNDVGESSFSIELKNVAAACETAIWQTAVYGDNGTPGWIGKVFKREFEAWRIVPLGTALYDGRVGVLTFLASVVAEQVGSADGQSLVISKAIDEIVTGQVEYSIKMQDRGIKQDVGKKQDLGIGIGIGGLLWGALAIAALLKSEKAWSALNRWIEQMSFNHLVQGESPDDLLTGKAGLLLVFDALLRCGVKVDMSDAMGVLLRDVCFATAKIREQALNSEPFQGPHLGFAHGLSGMALALLRASIRVRDRSQTDQAIEHFKFLNEEEKKWSALSFEERKKTFKGIGPLSWCNGIVGCLASSLSAYALLQDPAIIENIESILDGLTDWPLVQSDTLCCGNSGRIALFNLAAEILHRPDYRTHAVSIARKMINRCQADLEFSVGVARGFVNPTLFQGLAGIGHTLLNPPSLRLIDWTLSVEESVSVP